MCVCGGGVVCHSIEVCGQPRSCLMVLKLLASLSTRNPTHALSESGVLLDIYIHIYMCVYGGRE